MFAKQFHALKLDGFSCYVDVDALKATVQGYKAEKAKVPVVKHAAEYEALLLKEAQAVEGFFAQQDYQLRKKLTAAKRLAKGSKQSPASEAPAGNLQDMAATLLQGTHNLRLYCDMNARALDHMERVFYKAAGIKGRFEDSDAEGDEDEEQADTVELFPSLREHLSSSSLQTASTNLMRIERDIAGMLREKPLKTKKAPVDETAQHIKKLVIKDVAPGSRRRFWLELTSDSLGQPISVPVIVIRGLYDGPTVGITAALHGNELNGVPVIHQIVSEVDEKVMCGTLVCVVVTNAPGFLLNRREFGDGVDLNRIMPGKPDGNRSQQYAHKIVKRLLSHFDYLLDLHTASIGRRNALYVRADMNIADVHTLAMLSEPQIIVHNTGPDGSLRGAAAALGIPAITVEIADPSLFQAGYIHMAVAGVRNVLRHLNLFPQPPVSLTDDEDNPEDDERVDASVVHRSETVVCGKSYWMFTDAGGLLEVMVRVTDLVTKGMLLARIKNIFGDMTKEYYAKEAGIVVGRNANPAAQTGDRIVHIGIPTRTFASKSNDGH